MGVGRGLVVYVGDGTGGTFEFEEIGLDFDCGGFRAVTVRAAVGGSLPCPGRVTGTEKQV